MLLNQPIGIDKEHPELPYIDGALFQSELFELDGQDYDRIIVNINSPGGNVIEGYNICNAFLQTKTPVDTCCTGIAASMAAVAFMCGRKRIMYDYSALMIHNPFGGDDKKMLKALEKSLVKMVAAKSKLSEDQVAKMMEKETWISAEEAVEMGFATEIKNTSEENIKRMPKAATASIRAMWSEANNIQNNISQTFLNKDFMADATPTAQAKGLSLVAAYLDLNIDSSENAILVSMREKINTSVVAKMKAEEMLDEMKAKLDKKEKEFSALKKEYDDKIIEYKEEEEKRNKIAKDAMEADQANAKRAETEAKKATCKVEIEKYVAVGRVKADQVDKLVDLAMKTDMKDVVALLGELPINKEVPGAANITTKDTGVPGNPNVEPMSAMALQARVKATQNARYKQAK